MPKYDHPTARRLEGGAGFWASELRLDDPVGPPVFVDIAGLPPVYIGAGGRVVLLTSIQTVAERLPEGTAASTAPTGAAGHRFLDAADSAASPA